MAVADDLLYPIAVLIDELRNEDVQVSVIITVYISTAGHCVASDV